MSIERVCAAHHDVRQLRLALLDELRRIAPFDAFAWLLTDPTSEVGVAPIADCPCLPELPKLIRLKYATSVNRWTEHGDPVRRLHASTDGHLERSLMWREMLVDLGVTDVASIVFRDDSGCWSFLDLWRMGGAFGDGEAEALRVGVDEITSAIRRCLLRTFDVLSEPPPPQRSGPLVLVLSSAMEVRSRTADTERYLRAMVPPDGAAPAVPAAAYNVAAQLLAVETGVDDHPPVARVWIAPGEWLTVRAARIDDGFAVTFEDSSAGERRDLFCRSAALSARETEVVHRLAAGADTRHVAKQMYVSEYTVQDHLKSVFAKTGTHSRRELLARWGR